jgi:hypothetical protein
MHPQPRTLKENQNVPTQDVRYLFEMKSEQNVLNTGNTKSMSTQTAIRLYIKLLVDSDSLPFPEVKAAGAWG